MKTNKYVDLVKFGLKPKTLMSLNESEINRLHKNLIENKKRVTKEETKQTVVQSTYDTSNADDQKKLAQKGVKVDPVTKKITLNNGSKSAPKNDVIKDGEMSESKSKKDDYGKINPWRICHSQLGPKKTPKFERCVKAIKQSMNEGKNPFSVILENKILSLVEKHLKPKMTKGDLMDLLGKKISVSENTKEKEAPVKDPGTKTPSKPKTKDPFKPEPHKNPKPKAHHDEPKKHHHKHETKEFVMDAPAPTKEPKVTPGTKTPPKPKTKDPFKPEPHKQPNPKARKKLPSWLTFNNLGIKFKK